MSIVLSSKDSILAFNNLDFCIIYSQEVDFIFSSFSYILRICENMSAVEVNVYKYLGDNFQSLHSLQTNGDSLPEVVKVGSFEYFMTISFCP